MNGVSLDNYRLIKRWLAAIIAIALWVASINFSLDGFDGGMGTNVGKLGWVGWTLAALVTIMELVWNTPGARSNTTIFATGVLCYMYGIYTNVAGFYFMQGNTWETFKAEPITILFPFLVGLLCEVVPEVLLVWAVLGDEGSPEESDFFGNLFGVKTGGNHRPVPNYSSQKSNFKPASSTPNYKSANTSVNKNRPSIPSSIRPVMAQNSNKPPVASNIPSYRDRFPSNKDMEENDD